jgi:hypothetical protein
MRALAIVLLLASVAHAKDVDWEGLWLKDGGGSVTVELNKGTHSKERYSVNEDLQVGDDKLWVTLYGSGKSQELTMTGKLMETVGFVGALDRRKLDKPQRAATLTATEHDDGSEEVADVVFTVEDMEPRRETWRRKIQLLKIVDLSADGQELTGELDVKWSHTGLDVHYRVEGNDPLPLEATILVDPARHAYADFYSGPLWRESLGAIEPGDHHWGWEGRDQTAAARLALGGGYIVKIAADETRSATKNFAVAPPHFEYIGSPRFGSGDHLHDPTARGAQLSVFASADGYSVHEATPATNYADAAAGLPDAGACIIHTHGLPSALCFYGGDPLAPIATGSTSLLLSSDVKSLELKDLHFVIVSACWGAADFDDESDGFHADAIGKSLVDAGCDLAIAFDHPAPAQEDEVFEDVLLQLFKRGASIPKAAKDAARLAFVFMNMESVWKWTSEQVQAFADGQRHWRRSKPDDKDPYADYRCLLGSICFFRGGGIPEDESFWPPRYGNSKN